MSGVRWLLDEVEVLGQPVGKGRPRAVRTPAGGIRTHTPDRTAAYESLIAETVQRRLGGEGQQGRFAGPVEVVLTFALRRPKSVSARKRPLPVVKPDVDNLVKAVLDGLGRTSLWVDDSQVVSLSATKVYADDEGELPRTVISVCDMEAPG